MLSRDLTDAAARLLAGATCPLDRVATLLPQLLPGCGAATAARWRDGKAIEMAASERSVADLLASQLERGSGPVIDALRSGHVWCTDTRSAGRWPGFRADTLRAGIRSQVTLAQRSGATVITVTLYGVKPNSLGPDTAALALLFTASGAVRPDAGTGVPEGTGSGSGRPRSAAVSALDQATALLMRALSATEQEAGDILQATSRECGADIDLVAQWLVTRHARAAASIGDPARIGNLAGIGDLAGTARPAARVRPVALAAPAGPDARRTREPARPPRQRQERLPAVMASGGPSPRATRESRLLPGLVEQAARLRQQLAGAASSLARTEERLADTFERTAVYLPRHAHRLSAMATAARRYSRHVDQLAQDFSKEHGRSRQHA